VVDDLQKLARATLHHRACRPPQWSDSFTVHKSRSVLLARRTVVLLLPFQVGAG
jgi:hypothetical protein